MAKASRNTGGMKKARKKKAGGAPNCQNGMPGYRTRQLAEEAGSGAAFRCDSCRQWHNDADRRKRGRKPQR